MGIWTNCECCLDSAAVSIFVVILVELTNTVIVFVNSTNKTTNIETAALSIFHVLYTSGIPQSDRIMTEQQQ